MDGRESPNDSEQNIFQGMFSLLKPGASTAEAQQSLSLPDIFANRPSAPDLREGQSERPRMKNTACPHTERKHYAKNMCSNCYHSKGRKKLAWLCQHKDRKLYARGRCQYCYIQYYYRYVAVEKERSREREELPDQGAPSDH